MLLMVEAAISCYLLVDRPVVTGICAHFIRYNEHNDLLRAYGMILDILWFIELSVLVVFRLLTATCRTRTFVIRPTTSLKNPLKLLNSKYITGLESS